MLLDLTDDEVQVVLNSLAEQPARISYNVITRVVQQQQAHAKQQAAHASGLADSLQKCKDRPAPPTPGEPDDHYSRRDEHYP